LLHITIETELKRLEQKVLAKVVIALRNHLIIANISKITYEGTKNKKKNSYRYSLHGWRRRQFLSFVSL